MVRLSSLLPIIKLAPILEHDPRRLPNPPPDGGKPGAAKDSTEGSSKANPVDSPGAKQMALTRDSLVIRSADNSAIAPRERPASPTPNHLAQTQLVQTEVANTEVEPGAERTPGQASPLAKSASYSRIGLLNTALPAALTGTPPALAEQPRFSATATLLASLTPKTAQTNVPAQIRSPAPLIPGAPDRPAVLAAALRDAISLSGLFYESHLEQWSNGALPLEALKQEPQAALPPVLNFNPAANGSPPAGQSQPTVANEPLAWLQQNLVQQLGVLNNPTLAWSGQVWPGQSVAIQTGRDPARSTADEAPWVTRLSLDMPHLGKIEIVISLDNRGVELDVRGEATGALNAMQARQADLGRQLADTGCSLRRMQIRSSREPA
jgi:hypothetical protein